MKLQFSANQDYQLSAIKSIVGLFEGQPSSTGGAELTTIDDGLSSLALTEWGLANRLALTQEQLLANCRTIQKTNRLPESETLIPLTLDNGNAVGAFPNFTVEMETGTGKTYVYLRSIYELNKVYGFKKFVIVVPSVAIREGALKNLQITHDHFQSIYNHEPLSFMVYDSGKVNQLRNFALSSAIQVLVINIDAFAKDSTETNGDSTLVRARKQFRGNIINQLRETGTRPIEFIQATRPIVIVDEPQNMETDIRKQAIVRLNPLCTLRYSATPRNAYDLIYKMDPVRAFELGLVKQISVDSVVELKDANQAFIQVEGFKTTKKSVSAKLKIWVNGANGPEKKSIAVRAGGDKSADLYELSGHREMYRDGFIVNEIDAGEAYVRFANGVSVRPGNPQGTLTDTILRLQIEATIKRHFEKEAKLKSHGIKVLSVFFIDRVANYREYLEGGRTKKGKFAEWFEEIFEQYRAKPEFSSLYAFDAIKAHNGYFSQDKTAITPFEVKEGKSNTDAIDNAFELIMRDKERLLEPEEPLRFIFSHSALREGWDNPNVFQICTLAETSSELKKRQEIGRGLRLCVNDKGERVFERNINRLTIIANESYEDFAQTLQTEMEQAGVAFKKEMVQNEQKKVTVRLKKGYETDADFIALWDRIKERTRYRVQYSTEKLIKDSVAEIRKLPPTERPKIAIGRADIKVSRVGVEGVQTGLQTREVQVKYIIPDLVGQIQAKVGLSRSTVASILLESKRLKDAVANPQAFIDCVSDAINGVKRALLVEGVEYVKVAGLVYEMHRFLADDLMEIFESNVIAVSKNDKTLFSHIVIDSNSSPERKFAEACETSDDVHFYIKLPRWFQIETPVGPYNPDWALVYKNDQTLYFVAETKDTGTKDGVNLDLLRPLEKLKIECGKRHFKHFEQVRFKVVKSLTELVS